MQMEFKIDEQTLNDLELFNQALDGKSIFSCFNTACSDGGKACVRKMLERPLTDVNKIRARVEAIRYLGQLPFFLDIRREELSFIEVYLQHCLLYTSPSPRDISGSRMPSSA